MYARAVPVLAGSGSKRFALAVTALSGASEPLGALLGVLFMRGTWLRPLLGPAIEASLAACAGVMIWVSFCELLPQAMRNLAPQHRYVVAAGFAGGAALIGATLLLL